MLKVTDAALQRLLNAVHEAQDPETTTSDACFRIVPNDGASLGLALQSPAPSDLTFEHEGTTVLAIPEALLQVCAQRTLDVDADGYLVLE
jgi:hypothetical protein